MRRLALVRARGDGRVEVGRAHGTEVHSVWERNLSDLLMPSMWSAGVEERQILKYNF